MQENPITSLANDVGCLCCGASDGPSYWLECYCLPSRLVRKRHREKENVAVYCRKCFEAETSLRLLFGAAELSVAKSRVKDLMNLTCIHCGDAIRDGELYGVVAVALFTGGTPSDSYPAAHFCRACVEGNELTFANHR